MATIRQRNWIPLIFVFTIVLVGIIAALFFLPGYKGEVGFDVTILPMLNAIYNCFTFSFLLIALYAVKRKNIKMHRTFIWAAFGSTFLFLITYVIYQFLTEPTMYGGSEAMRNVYLIILLSHITLAIVNVPLALISLTYGLGNRIAKHRKIAKVTMPIWLYVSSTGVIVYLMISPYY
ncbi:MAG TPA: DUF420 domain-containing protein [Paenibacillus sp.]|uniref:DUF420 domain-containing protein n=1 Tax=Paenibacillus sp. TaxID=58172 RepID=UPI0028D110D6|nr:DUF420 domain-containing protein [Paenibacillus sp.]HUC92735.1 DUF420 domain-containing protein [Paenibacillus sp.]